MFRRAETGWDATRPDELVLGSAHKRRKEIANSLLAHAAMANMGIVDEFSG